MPNLLKTAARSHKRRTSSTGAGQHGLLIMRFRGCDVADPIVAEAIQFRAMPAEVAQRWGIGTALLYTWRRQLVAARSLFCNDQI